MTDIDVPTTINPDAISKLFNLQKNLMEPDDIRIIKNTKSRIILKMTYKKNTDSDYTKNSKLQTFINYCCNLKSKNSFNRNSIINDETKNVSKTALELMVKDEQLCANTESTSSTASVKLQYYALCVPEILINNPDNHTQINNIRYCNPGVEEFHAPKCDEIVAIPIELIEHQKRNENNNLNKHEFNYNLNHNDVRKILKIIFSQNKT